MFLTKICMPPQRCLPSLGSNVVVGGVWDSWAQGWLTLPVLGKLPRQDSCRGRGGHPGKGLAGGVHLAPLLFVSLVLALPCLSRALVSLRLPSSALLSVAAGAALTARALVKGSKGEPLLLYTDRSPWAWATHKRDALLGQAQNGARAGGADFTVVTFRPLRFPTTRVERATWRVVHDMGVMHGAVPTCMRHIVVKRRLAPSP